jgi:hypothetical protein
LNGFLSSFCGGFAKSSNQGTSAPVYADFKALQAVGLEFFRLYDLSRKFASRITEAAVSSQLITKQPRGAPATSSKRKWILALSSATIFNHNRLLPWNLKGLAERGDSVRAP